MVDPSLRSGQGLPSGTVTFLLTDIEGSTALWEASPEAMRLAVARYDALLTELIERHGGAVVRSRGEGDSFFAVFRRATDAVAAACGTQQALHAEAWPTEVPIRVRIALYAGEAELREGDYYGAAVNRCARLRAVAYQEHDLDAARKFREEAAAVARANHDRHTLGLSLAGLGLVARMQGHREESAKLLHETLLVGSELNDQRTISRALGGLAGAAVLAEEYRRAARLFGVMVAMRELSGIGEATGFFRALCERDEADARAALGSEAFQAAWEEGRAMDPEQAIAYALEDA